MKALDVVIDPWIINQGATFFASYAAYSDEGVLLDLSGYAAMGQLRTGYKEDPVVLTFSTENNKIELVNGEVHVVIPSDDTKLLEPDTDYVFDIEMAAPTGYRYRIVEGIAIVRPEVTIE